MENQLKPITNDQKITLDWSYLDFQLHIECDFSVKVVEGIGVGYATINWFDLLLFKEKLVIVTFGGDDIVMSGNGKIFPDSKLIGLEGNFRLSARKDFFEIAGDAKVNIVGLAMVAGTLQIGTKNFAVHGDLVGTPVTLIFSYKDDIVVVVGKFKEDGHNSIDKFSFTCKIGKNKGEATFHVAFCQIMDFSALFDYASTSTVHGNATLKMLSNVDIFKGTVSVEPEAQNGSKYGLQGDLFIFPPSSASQFNIHVDGRINKNGFLLTGNNTFGCPQIIRLFTSATIDNGLPQLSSKVTVLGVDYTASSGLYQYNTNNVAFCLWYTLPPVKIWFFKWIEIVPAITYYFMVSPSGLYGPSFIKPAGWPVKVGAPSQKELALDPIEIKIEDLPTANQSIKYIENLLSGDYANPIEEESNLGHLTTILYDLEFKHETVDQKSVITANIYKTAKLEKILENIFNKLNPELIGLSDVDELEFCNDQGKQTIAVKYQGKTLKTIEIDPAESNRISKLINT